MKAHLEKIKNWWSHCSVREKRTVTIGGSFLAIFIFYAGIWKPLFSYIDAKRVRIVSQQKTLLWMQAADTMLSTMENKTSVKNKPVSLVMFLSQCKKQVNQAGLETFLTELKQSDNETVEMHFQKVEFDKMIQMMMKIMKEYPVMVSRFSVAATDVPGYVSADVWMKQTG